MSIDCVDVSSGTHSRSIASLRASICQNLRASVHDRRTDIVLSQLRPLYYSRYHSHRVVLGCLICRIRFTFLATMFWSLSWTMYKPPHSILVIRPLIMSSFPSTHRNHYTVSPWPQVAYTVWHRGNFIAISNSPLPVAGKLVMDCYYED